MKKEDMTKIVNEELKHIPRGSYDQNKLRLLYNITRRMDLKSGKSRTDTLIYCIEYMKKNHPTFIPIYDKDFFSK
ncbi:MAG: hypothetical protein H3Z54_09590 [archaeon]|nr:hypothetical protein [archaeon]